MLTSAPISSLAVELLQRQIVLPATVSRIPGPDYDGPSGGTVTLRVPRPRLAGEQVTPGATISFADVDEDPVNVVLRHFYDATRVTDEDLALTVENFGRQVLAPQVAAIAERSEKSLADAMLALTASTTIEWAATATESNTIDTVLAAREALSSLKVPIGNRYLAVAPDIATRLLNTDRFAEADKRGSATALETAQVGNLYGFTIVESPALTDGNAIAYHSSAFAFGNRPPTAPAGVDATTATEQGVSLRHILQFDPNRLSSASVVSVFVGCAAVPDYDTTAEEQVVTRAIKIGTAEA